MHCDGQLSRDVSLAEFTKSGSQVISLVKNMRVETLGLCAGPYIVIVVYCMLPDAEEKIHSGVVNHLLK